MSASPAGAGVGLCVTGAEPTVELLARRLAAHPRVPLQEVRLDLLRRIDDDVWPLLRSPRILVTCRRREEGGGFAGTEAERVELLRRALEQAPGWVDLEAQTPAELRRDLVARRGPTRLVLSWHGEALDGARAGLLEPAAACSEAQALKLALPVEDAADLGPLLDLPAPADRPLLRIGVGPAGLLSRALYPAFGSPWTYVVPDGAAATAPGQIAISVAEAWRLDEPKSRVPLALLGGAQVLASPGPSVYNQLFCRERLPQLYLPVVTARPEAALALLARLGCAGASVTMPLKETLARLCAPGDEASRLGALNTIVRRGERWLGFNTDVGALTTLLEPHAGHAALVLGSGGAALAAVLALRALGSPVALCGRTPGRASALAARLGCSSVEWDARARVAHAVLVNATPCGADGVGDPWPAGAALEARVVLDAVISTAAATPLVRRARATGALAIEGIEWWLRQGARQIDLLVGRSFAPDELRAALPGPGGPR